MAILKELKLLENSTRGPPVTSKCVLPLLLQSMQVVDSYLFLILLSRMASPISRCDALVSNSKHRYILLVRHLLLVAMHLFLVAY